MYSYSLFSEDYVQSSITLLSCFRNVPVVIEWKKSSRDKSSLQATYDAPVQLAAYMGAVNNDVSYDFKVFE